MTRDDFSAPIKRKLAMRSAFICSNPECRRQTIAPALDDDEKYLYIGKAAHIAAAAEGGPRYDANQSPKSRSSISNGIFLCSNCSDLIDKNGGTGFSSKTLNDWKKEHENWVSANLNKTQNGIGGEGGGGTIFGDRGVVIGGKGGNGGNGGISGIGGKGGSGFVYGNDGLVIGGDGGNGPTADGRGGKGARGPTERFGFPSQLWGYGRGGSSTNLPEYDRRMQLLIQFRQEYKTKFPDDACYIDAGVDVVPAEWINQRLEESGESWEVEMRDTGYTLPPITGADPL